jgi:hypothetical protein
MNDFAVVSQDFLLSYPLDYRRYFPLTVIAKCFEDVAAEWPRYQIG